MTRRVAVLLLLAALALSVTVAAPTFRNDTGASATSWVPLAIGLAVLATVAVLAAVWGRTHRGSDRR